MDIVQEAVIKKKKFEKAKWLSEEALQIPEKIKVKGRGEKGRYIHLNAEFQRRPKRDKMPSSMALAKKSRKTIEWERL